MKNPGTVTKVVQVTTVLLVTMVRLDAQTDRELTSAEFANKILTLHWTDQTSDIARLRDDGDCIYAGHLERDARSSVFVTGCEDGTTGVQIQSTVVGDMLFTLMKNGSIVYPTFDHEDEYEDYLENDDFDAEYGVIAEKNGRHKREDYSDEDYYYDEPAENPEFDENYPDLDENEVGDIPIPTKFILNINVYLDRSWYEKFGKRGSVTKARQILRHAQELYMHPSLNVTMDLQFGDRIYKSRAGKLQPNARGLKALDQYLQEPYKMNGTFPVAHVHLTTRRSRAVGFAVLDSICDEKPKAIVKFKDNLLRTAMTVAHELGHVLGMQHDFIASEGREEEVCQKNRKTGGTIMNYGSPRDVWSNCSNEDFKVFYNRIFVKKGAFCLEDPSPKVCKCNGLVDVVGGECKVDTASFGGYWCYVDENSSCQDKQDFFGNYISNIPCSSGDRSQAVIGCHPDQWQCKSSKQCISKSHRCDGSKRHCSDGSDEANCPFIFDK